MKNVNRAAVKADYLSGLSYRELAEKYGVGIGTISRWARADGWDVESIRAEFPVKLHVVEPKRNSDEKKRNKPESETEQTGTAFQNPNEATAIVLPLTQEEAATQKDYEMIRESALRALQKINALLDLPEALAPRDIKAITGSLLDLKSQLGALSPREMREQAARLRQLEKTSEQSRTEPVKIEFIDLEGSER